jgi:hypothetical protein
MLKLLSLHTVVQHHPVLASIQTFFTVVATSLEVDCHLPAGVASFLYRLCM